MQGSAKGENNNKKKHHERLVASFIDGEKKQKKWQLKIKGKKIDKNCGSHCVKRK